MSETKLQIKRRALCLLSGGLDSQLAVCVLKGQGVDVKGVVFDSPFFNTRPALRAAEQLAIDLVVLDFTADIIELVEGPSHGFGSEMNPCIDCHGRMIKRAGEQMHALGCDFIATGEVLNERPMSQIRRSLNTVARESGVAELLLRPLSARLLEETLPERAGWVDRSRLLALEGRSRKPQFQLAKDYGLTWYPTPAGGCSLTEPNFCIRLKELIGQEGLRDVRQLRLLKLGRHSRIAPKVKLIVGRDKSDNEAIVKEALPGDVLYTITDVPGPAGLLTGASVDAYVHQCASICAAYSDAAAGTVIRVNVRRNGLDEVCEVTVNGREQHKHIRA
jgi:tRNA-uridine 2-sulfurtransferase